MKRWIPILVVLLLPTMVFGQSLFGTPGRSQATSMFQDRRPMRAQRIGDILTVLIMESTSATNTAQTDTDKEMEVNWASPGGLKLPGFGLSGKIDSEFESEGTVSRQQQITARVSVTVVDIRPNGDLVVEGSRAIEINGETEVIYLTGMVNPLIIPASNTVESFRVADLQVSYKGKGVITQGTRPGFFVRFLNWIF